MKNTPAKMVFIFIDFGNRNDSNIGKINIPMKSESLPVNQFENSNFSKWSLMNRTISPITKTKFSR